MQITHRDVGILKDMRVKLSMPTLLYCDNKFAMQITINSLYYQRTKHIEAYYHLVKDKIQETLIKASYVSTNDQTTDFLQRL